MIAEAEICDESTQCSNFWSNFRPFSTKFKYCSMKCFFRQNGFRRIGSFNEMAIDQMALDEVSRIRGHLLGKG